MPTTREHITACDTMLNAAEALYNSIKKRYKAPMESNIIDAMSDKETSDEVREHLWDLSCSLCTMTIYAILIRDRTDRLDEVPISLMRKMGVNFNTVLESAAVLEQLEAKEQNR